MKKCPTCSKEFPDSMRFCQSDGTPLLEIVESAPIEDPYKTTVAKPEDIAAAIPPVDPFKTVVGSAPPSDDSGDLLQLPQEHDPLKTAFVPEAQLRQELNLDELKIDPPAAPKDAPVDDAPAFPPLPSPEDFKQTPVEDAPAPNFNIPEPPKFSEPNLSPPSFGDLSSSSEKTSGAAEENIPTFDTTPPPIEPDNAEPPTLISEQPFEFNKPPVASAPPSPFDTPKFEPPSKIDAANDSPFGSPFNTPIPSPFDDAKPASYQAPSTPLPSFKEPEPVVSEPVNDPFAPTPFGQANNPLNQPVKQNDWTPPPAPEANWQNQNIGQNTPFQPPVAQGSVNQTLPIISLVLGIISLCCYVSPLTGLAALITGYLGMKNANNDPANYGGKGLAIAGMVMGGLFFLIGVIYYILVFIVGFAGMIPR